MDKFDKLVDEINDKIDLSEIYLTDRNAKPEQV